MSRQRISTIITLLCLMTTLQAQKLVTKTPLYDCGQVLFRNPVTTEFVIKNKSSRHLEISEIKTSCGCTIASTDHNTIAGGKEATIKVVFDAKQLGHFQKDIWVYVKGEKKPLELTMKGVVVTHIKDYSGTYPYQLGQIRADKAEIEFDDVNQGSMPMQTIHILNTSGATAEPVVMHLPDYMIAEVSPTRLAPEQGGEIRLILLSSKIRDFGLTQTNIYLGKFPGDKISNDKEIPVSAVVIPSYQSLDNDALTAPKIQLSSTAIDRKKMTGKPEKLKGEIVLQNMGKSTLEISALQMFTAGMSVALGKTKLEPMETTKLKVQVNDTELQQIKQRPRILMITNDPKQPKIIIEVL